MRHKSRLPGPQPNGTPASPSASERLVRDIRRVTRKHYSAEDKIRIVLDGLRGEVSIAELCRREGIAESLYYSWSKEFLEAGKRRLAGDMARSATTEIPLVMLSDLLWAAFGVNSAEGNRTAPTALNAQEIDVYLALPQGAYCYDAERHDLQLVSGSDVRRVTGYQDFVDEAPLDLVFVADHRRMAMVPAGQRESYASVAAGAIAQNVYLYAASVGLVTVLRGWIDREALATALGLTPDEHLFLSQTVGFPKA